LHSQHLAQIWGAVMRLWITVMKQNGHGHVTANRYQHWLFASENKWHANTVLLTND